MDAAAGGHGSSTGPAGRRRRPTWRSTATASPRSARGRAVAAGAGAEVVDLDGLVLAPGFIDIHTHYDAQILWDPDLTPSCWHGVTSVVMGNCGFGVAPTRPEHRDTIVRTLENVEGMSVEALDAGHRLVLRDVPRVPRCARRSGPSGSTSAAFIGHTPLRLFVLGGEERAATADEVDAMCALVREAMDAGAHRLLDLAAARPPGRVRPPGAEPVRRGRRGLRPRLGARRAGPGHRAGVHRPGAVRRPVLRAGGAPRRPVTWTALVTRADKPGAAMRTVERARPSPARSTRRSPAGRS